MKFLRNFVRFILVLLILGGVGAGAFYYFFNVKEPVITPSNEADLLAEKMLTALNYEALKKTRYLKWSFNQATDYLYDRNLGVVNVRWDDNEVELFLNDSIQSAAFSGGLEIADAGERTELVQTATRKFNNDSFWLLGPYKLFDEGSTRSIVEGEDGQKSLMITYNSGGDTPGDKYLWLLDERGFPMACQMWVQILPIGGTEASWDDWVVTETGAFLPKSHKMLGFTIDMGEVEGFNTPRKTPKP